MLQRENNAERGVAVIIAFIIAIGILSIGAMYYQSTVIPAQDFNKENSHSKEIQKAFDELESQIQFASQGSSETVQVPVGLRYGGVSLDGLHSPPVPGHFYTSEYNLSKSKFSIENAARDSSFQPFWNGSTKNYSTKYVTYNVDYHYYVDAPSMVYENSLSYSHFKSGSNSSEKNIYNSEQKIIKGNKISLISLTGNLSSTNLGSKTIQIVPVSASEEVIQVRGHNSSKPLNITIPSHLNETEWEALLQEQLVENGGHVKTVNAVKSNGDEEYLIEIALEQNQSYELSMARLRLQSRNLGNSGANYTLEEQYADWIGNSNLLIKTNDRRFVEVTARDRYNNPVPGTKVYARANESTLQPRLNFYFEEINDSSVCEGSFASANSTCTGASGELFWQPGKKYTDSSGTTTFIYSTPEYTVSGHLVYPLSRIEYQETHHVAMFPVNRSIVGSSFDQLSINYLDGETDLSGVAPARGPKNGSLNAFVRFGADTDGDGSIETSFLDNVTDGKTSDSASTLNIELDGSRTLRYGDKIIFEYSDVVNPINGTHPVNITVNNQETYSGSINISKRNRSDTLDLCGGDTANRLVVDSDGSVTGVKPTAVDINGSQNDVYSGIKFGLRYTGNQNVQKVNDVCVASSSYNATEITRVSSRPIQDYGSIVWFDGRTSDGYVLSPSPLKLGNITSFEQTGNLGKNSGIIFKINKFQGETSSPVDMRGETVKVTFTYRSGPDSISETVFFTLRESQDNNPP